MSLKQQIDTDIKNAMKAKNKEELQALRSIKSMILLAESEKGAEESLSEDAEMKLLMKAAKQRKESAETYKANGRDELANAEMLELQVIEKYLPKQMSEEELTEKLKEIIQNLGASGPQDMGKVMGVATKELAGKADGKMISQLVKQILTS
ncbi:GatB/YqeY domain-containing protein [Marivirga harenae]|uniref:GatB/YqeY domain-containing protein n=1 Tax=Marivirga harenae TaxID=2010992 RepID=UPI0026E07671|nr:GatB/YqeY domain-containing protein [Marivirga harenae]WKV13688.1 GatB/YqeY domain-containing protein [Marivirga harenae]|tara:strand:+ start:58537 stop:58989 length:453 start_codon:yes stop_codon:yes gene_type:complete